MSELCEVYEVKCVAHWENRPWSQPWPVEAAAVLALSPLSSTEFPHDFDAPSASSSPTSTVSKSIN